MNCIKIRLDAPRPLGWLVSSSPAHHSAQGANRGLLKLFKYLDKLIHHKNASKDSVILLESIETGETFRVAVCKQFVDFLIAYGHFLDWN